MHKQTSFTKYYAVEVSGLPSTKQESAPSEKEVKDHFERLFGKVHECAFTRDYGDIIDLHFEASRQKKLLEIAEERAMVRLSSARRGPDSQVAAIKKRYDGLLQKANRANLMNFKSSDFPITGAFVIFENEKSQRNCLHSMNHFKTLKCNGDYPSEFLLNGHHLSVKEAPEPHSIFWENYNISSIGRFLRGFFIYILLLILLCVTYAFAYIIKKQYDQTRNLSTCNLLYLYSKSDTVSSAAQLLVVKACTCSYFNFWDLQPGGKGAGFHDLCIDTVGNSLYLYYFTAAYGFLIFFVNLLMYLLVKYTHPCRRDRNVTNKGKSAMTMLAVA